MMISRGLVRGTFVSRDLGTFDTAFVGLDRWIQIAGLEAAEEMFGYEAVPVLAAVRPAAALYSPVWASTLVGRTTGHLVGAESRTGLSGGYPGELAGRVVSTETTGTEPPDTSNEMYTSNEVYGSEHDETEGRERGWPRQ